ncbi:MAG: alanine--tRNA ligase-related protein [Candidatus Micrarchaeota archaeon]
MAHLPTSLLYLEDMHSVEGTAQVQAVESADGGKTAIVLDRTIFYPQGGGQPFDTGEIALSDGTAAFEVLEVRMREGGIVHHIGAFKRGVFPAGAEVVVHVDAARRMLNSRLHTAGHLMDAALRNIGRFMLPGKGYHYPVGAYVEYEGIIPEGEREKIRADLENETDRLIAAGYAVRIVNATKEEVGGLCGFCPEYVNAMPAGAPVRVVFVGEGYGCPCGGTHVKDVKEIDRLTIAKIAVKGGKTRVSYSVE